MTDEVIELVGEASPRSAEAVRCLRQFLATDGALKASEKHVSVAAAAAAHGQTRLLVGSLEEARRLSVSPRIVLAAERIVLLNRGEEAATQFGSEARRLFSLANVTAPRNDEDLGLRDVDALEYFRRRFGGEIPERTEMLARLAPPAFLAYYAMHRSALAESTISPKAAELILCTLTASEYQSWALEIHMRSAQAEGATEQELAEAIVCAIPVAGFAAWANSAGALAAVQPQVRGAVGPAG
jgi:alkylhydroperoxidase/carboxymuconolactone decarboxylase family protein YurZ